MKKARLLVVLFLCGVVLASGIQWCFAATAPKPAPRTQAAPGLEAAKTLSMITGVAISPLLGVGAVGSYTWFKCPKAERARLHWYAQPWFWIPALVLVVLVGVKDILGTAAPTALKKPFDVAETVENKISGLIAAGAFIPLIISVFPEAVGGGPEALNYSPLAAAGFAAIDLGSIGNALLIPFALAAFIVVWLASHAINILILLSPFTILDTILKSVRVALLSFVAGSSFTNPYMGAVISFIMIIAAYFVAGWSFRLTVMGTVFVWDVLTFRRLRFQPGAETNKMFLGKPTSDAPARSYGRLLMDDAGRLVFEYRPWLILPKRRVTLPEGTYIVGRGIFYPEIAQTEADRLLTRFVLPPRYNEHEEALARTYGLGPVQDVGIRKGLKEAWRWLQGLFGPEPAPDPVTVEGPP